MQHGSLILFFILMPAAQARYWLLTIPHHEFTPFLPDGVAYLRGQLESGHTTGYLHWQLLVTFKTKVRLATVKRTFGDSCHAEPSRSDAADEYVWKEDTRVDGTQFELGCKPLQRNSKTDWDRVRTDARAGRLDDIDADVYVRFVSCFNPFVADLFLQPLQQPQKNCC